MNRAKEAKIDEYYTLLPDIEEELRHYIQFFKNKNIYCCCDHPKQSNFYKYFCDNFEELGIKKVVATCTNTEKVALYSECVSKDIINSSVLKGDGDIFSDECKPFFNEADIVVTNPPFSKTRNLIIDLYRNKKDFILVANRNIVITKLIFPLFINKDLKIGFGFKNNTASFLIPSQLIGKYSKDVTRKKENEVRFRNITWLTSLDINVPVKHIVLKNNYSQNKYPKYDQFDAINVDRISDIPIDYFGTMGVPITILDRFDFEQFELLGLDRYMQGNVSGKRFTINGVEKYARVMVRYIKKE